MRKGGSPEEIAAVVLDVADRRGREEAAALARTVIGRLVERNRTADLPAFVVSMGSFGVVSPPVAGDLLGIAEKQMITTGALQDGWLTVLQHVWRSASAAPEALDVSDLQRVAWTEARVRGRLTLVQFMTEKDPGAVVLAKRLLTRNPDPPLRVFLLLRDALRQHQAEKVR